ncbi:MAG: hypothetical protein ACI9TV_002373, partial [Sulfurimonas sp.]|uniref:hypothetical protein n=1 Tax=Sulfurimonas sp. TaxID=2022749 RepID=UPI0039E54B48
MAKFGLACEGITDQIVIENILCGFYKDIDDLDEEIQALQPPFDETTKKQADFGNWELLLTYLSDSRFRDDVLNSEYIIIQIDTDDAQHPNFNVSPTDSKNIELTITILIEKVIERLVTQIDSKESFYEENKEKIIFAISIHSLECWLLPLYKSYSNEKTKNCFDNLQRESKKISVIKNY